MSYKELQDRKNLYQAYSPLNAPVGVHVGIVPEGDDQGKLIMLNSALSPVRGMPAYENEADMLPVFNTMISLMSADDEMSIWKAAPRARDQVKWDAEAKAAGLSVADYRAQKEAERAAEIAKTAEAKNLRDRVKNLAEKGVKVRTGKKGTEAVLSGDMLEQFKAWVSANGENQMPLAEFLTTTNQIAEAPKKAKK